jgi:hypothetical protein
MGFNVLGALSSAAHAVLKVPGEVVQEGEKVLHHFVPDSVHLTPNLPPYEKLPAGALQQAEARGKGQTYKQECITPADGNLCEPVTMTIAGTKEQVEQALEKQGWAKADKLNVWNSTKATFSMFDKILGLDHIINYNYKASPMTVMHLHGKEQVMAFSKNNDHHTGRDHLRVFDSGKKDAQGRTIWEVAATRDTALNMQVPSMAKGHETDNNLDPERDMIMADLLKSGVKSWKAVQGTMSPETQAHVNSTYQTDGKVFQVTL